ncbi:MAG: ABC transporter permease [Pseudomonadota bacterium]|nr:MAG: hypothetical protein DIU72_09855 [Pseudomonadota bacterium]
MSALGIAIAATWASIRRAPLSHLIASLTVGATLVVAAGSGSLALGVRSLLDAWGSRVELTLYLSDELDEEEGRRLAQQAADTVGGSARWVSPVEAMERLRRALGDEEGILLDLPFDPLPASIELRPAGAAGVDELPHLAEVLLRLPGVEEVDWGRDWAQRLSALAAFAERAWGALLAILLCGAALLVGAVVRFAVHARREEIEILRLLGASDGFIRLPFLLEGLFAGALGGFWAALALQLLARWERRLDVALALPEELSLAGLAEPQAFAALVLVGALLGAMATLFALARELR